MAFGQQWKGGQMGSLHASFWKQLRCPSCRGALSQELQKLRCEACAAAFPIVRGVPVLLDGSKGLFSIEDGVASALHTDRPRTWRRAASDAVTRLLPCHAVNLAADRNMADLAARLRAEGPGARILVLGGAVLGIGISALVDEPSFVVAESDIVAGPRTGLLCDAGNIPFGDGVFDAVVAQALLGLVPDPFRVADEIHRVLRPRGYVYAESPFMQQVVGGPYDFLRFSHLGHRRLFRRFTEVRSGVACGPGMALSWALRYWLRTFADQSTGRLLASAAADIASSWLGHLDSCVAGRPGAFDAASGFYFLGRSAETTLSDREILALYRGAWRMHA